MEHQQKSPPRVTRFDGLDFAPRFAFPQMCKVVEVAGLADRSALAGGFARFTAAEIPWQLRYDELILVLEGEFTVETAEGRLSAGPRDTIWLPAGTKVTYIAENALVFYSLQPASWASEEAAL
ncbi:ethanolamine utilization protein EutQ [Pseudogemmobacter faecipullorum]|uniref:Ethanolamine utilization protein EutQ n=1 Tax=Pseudogemmobacter faecipullorum TaxID=2755041 RepID=A0ABS8CPC7_9RHOB|nr:ethanolamine utilization protein EutQ [Pseudogemmobacter faecipullorum]MCB5411241.1 ethanolamine utilization protein EutQ [Pseudogemmobacter faecipullorum]